MEFAVGVLCGGFSGWMFCRIYIALRELKQLERFLNGEYDDID